MATNIKNCYSYEQWCAVSDAVASAMEYAHDRAIECPEHADPLWNLDEYVNKVMAALSPKLKEEED